MSDQIYIIAGEMSGDVLGARLVQAFGQITSYPFVFAGIGGQAMQAAGVPSLFPIKDLSVMGFAEVLPRLPTLLKRIKQCADDIIARQPRVVVTIDSPGFCWRVVKRVKQHCPNTKFIHYVAPQVWAWKPERAAKMNAMFDGLMCLLPFELPYFQPHGLKTAFVGHPVVDTPQQFQQTRATFFEKYDLSLTNPPTILSLLFGSREGEVSRLSAPFYEAAYKLLREWPNMAVLVPTTPHLWEILKPIIGSDQRFIPVDAADRFQAFSLSNAAIAASGTVGLELAMLNVPHVVAYKFAPLTWHIGRRLVNVPHMHLVNLLMNDRIVPEFLQDQVTGTNIAMTILDLLVNRSGAADMQFQAFSQTRNLLEGANGGTPAQQAAAFVLGCL
jgi:lipid-A-disaccharide synthase